MLFLSKIWGTHVVSVCVYSVTKNEKAGIVYLGALCCDHTASYRNICLSPELIVLHICVLISRF